MSMLSGLNTSSMNPPTQGMIGRSKKFLQNLPIGSATLPTVGFPITSLSGPTGFYQPNANEVGFTLNGTLRQRFSSGAYILLNDASSLIFGASLDTILTRDAANIWGQRNTTTAQVFRVYNTFTSTTSYERYTIDWQTSALTCLVGPEKGSGGGTLRSQWQISEGGKKQVASNATNATTTFSNLTDLSITLLAARKYSGQIVIRCSNSVAVEGIKFDFNGGAATMTSFWAAVGVGTSSGTDTIGTSISTSLAGVINYSVLTGDTFLVFQVSMVVNAGGTFIMRFAENSTATGTATVNLGSFSLIEDCQ